MTSFFSIFLLPIALIAVTLVLLLGLFNMMRGGSPNTLAEADAAAGAVQFIAIVIAMLAVWAMGQLRR